MVVFIDLNLTMNGSTVSCRRGRGLGRDVGRLLVAVVSVGANNDGRR